MDFQAGSPFGTRLRQWRHRRGMSQLTLAGRVGSTSRHISFLETGRSRPSRQMTLRLADALDVGLREANRLLHAAGLPATFPQATFDGADLGQRHPRPDRPTPSSDERGDGPDRACRHAHAAADAPGSGYPHTVRDTGGHTIPVVVFADVGLLLEPTDVQLAARLGIAAPSHQPAPCASW